jgi:hypothetical protein
MAEHKPDDTNRITPREVEPDSDTPAGRARREREVSHDSGRSLRPDPEVVEADGGDIAGIAGGGIDDKVSGLGGDKNRR